MKSRKKHTTIPHQQTNTVVEQHIQHREQRITTDVPLLPVDQIERLHALDENHVTWLLQQAEKNATFRKEETAKNNTRVHRERMLGIVVLLLIPVCVSAIFVGGAALFPNQTTHNLFYVGGGVIFTCVFYLFYLIAKLFQSNK